MRKSSVMAARPPAHRVALYALSVVYIALCAAKVAASVPYAGVVLQNVAAALQLYGPIWYCDWHHKSLETLGLTSHLWRLELRDALMLGAGTLPAYGMGVHLYLTGFGHLAGAAPAAAFVGLHASFIPQLLWHLATQVLGVALPEEIFFRGFVLPSLHHRRQPAIVLAAGAFALAHWLFEWDAARLLTFFPGLIFGWQRTRRGSIVGCVALHAACNVFSEMCFAAYGLR